MNVCICIHINIYIYVVSQLFFVILTQDISMELKNTHVLRLNQLENSPLHNQLNGKLITYTTFSHI